MNKQPEFLLELDEEQDNCKNIASIDSAHHFLNFSRKITEASSMRKPVDIQLGIACGKDLLFNSPSRILRRPPQTLSFNNKTNPVKNNTYDIITSPLSKPSYPIDEVSAKRETNYRPSPMLLQMQQNSNIKSNNVKSSSSLLDQLVADVLSHIESCPDNSAYSDDLDKLKPKLQAYTVTRLPALKS
ncbi:hypothetical protein INT47_011826 [Mucor saturninus]|uniref:Uncharacterized protein n=1 Tax=Mucor saturninus TaxID=64648 RepID=A0A8H7RDN4_9FUNG|nr:hypothetical protein INT47_011826 [Mucor saturninus]